MFKALVFLTVNILRIWVNAQLLTALKFSLTMLTYGYSYTVPAPTALASINIQHQRMDIKENDLGITVSSIDYSTGI
jgi:hypothetical protein